MIIGVSKEIKTAENRVGATPAGVDVLVKAGHQVPLIGWATTRFRWARVNMADAMNPAAAARDALTAKMA